MRNRSKNSNKISLNKMFKMQVIRKMGRSSGEEGMEEVNLMHLINIREQERDKIPFMYLVAYF